MVQTARVALQDPMPPKGIRFYKVTNLLRRCKWGCRFQPEPPCVSMRTGVHTYDLPTASRHFSNNWSSVSTCSSGVFGDFPPNPAPDDVLPMPVVVVIKRINSSATSSLLSPVRGGVSFSSVI